MKYQVVGQVQNDLGHEDFGVVEQEGMIEQEGAEWALGEETDGAEWALGAPPRRPAVVRTQIPVKPAVPIMGKKQVHEPFIITPGGQGGAPAVLTANASGLLTIVFQFTVPAGLYLEFNPADKEQEVLFQPFDSTSTGAAFINGEYDVLIVSATGGRAIRVHHSHTAYDNPLSNVASLGNRRRWQHYAVAAPGDLVQTRFRSAAVLEPSGTRTVLVETVRVAQRG